MEGVENRARHDQHRYLKTAQRRQVIHQQRDRQKKNEDVTVKKQGGELFEG